jgi:methylmalonyl-CoA mutase
MTSGPHDELALASEFPAASRDEWMALVRGALKDRPFERLIAKTYDGIAIEPLDPRAADAVPLAGRSGPWQVAQRIDLPDPAAANAEALHELATGANALTLVFAGSTGDRGFGLPARAEALARALDGVYLDAGIAVELDLPPQSPDAGAWLAGLAKQMRLDPAALDIRFGFDPLGAMARAGGTSAAWDDLVPAFNGIVGDLLAQGFRGPFATADGRIVHDAGGSEAQELAFVLAAGVSYLRALERGGIALDDARRMVFFRLSADADQFLTVAKFRALRKLWARVEDACGLAPEPAFVSAETAWRMMTTRDPWVNLLRTTIACFAAGVGGANAIAVLPFTAALGLPDRFARRLARNIQLLLLEESHAARVADPAAGAGGIERLTNDLCHAAWALFQQIERDGGAYAALASGAIQAQVAAVRAEREASVARRKDAITGTSDYPLLGEAEVAVLDVQPAAPERRSATVTFPALPPLRLSEPFEALRAASDRALKATGARPTIFLANLGRLSDFTARQSFAKNLFEAGGIETPTNDGFADRDAMISAFRASGTPLACLCSSDAIYEADAADAARALAAAGARHIYLAGRPKDPEPYKAAGIGTFVFTGCDVLATLRAAHAMLGVKTERKP